MVCMRYWISDEEANYFLLTAEWEDCLQKKLILWEASYPIIIKEVFNLEKEYIFIRKIEKIEIYAFTYAIFIDFSFFPNTDRQ